MHYLINEFVHNHNKLEGIDKVMGNRHRNMYYLTGLPGWLRFGYSPGWIGRSPTGLPPTAQWLTQSGMLPQFLSYLGANTPYAEGVPQATPQTPTTFGMPFGPGLTKEQERQMLEQQMTALQSSLDTIKKRLEKLSE